MVLEWAQHKNESTMKNAVQMVVTWLFMLTVALNMSPPCFALSTDSHQRMLLSADNTELDYQHNIGIYKGNVQWQQGSVFAKADNMITHYDKNHNIESIELIGNAKYQSQPEANKPMLYADANKIIFYPKTHLAVLIGNAHVSQGAYEANGPYITYNTENKIMHLKSNAKQRTLMVFTPTP